MSKGILFFMGIWGINILLNQYGGKVFENLALVSSGKLDACLSKHFLKRKEA